MQLTCERATDISITVRIVVHPSKKLGGCSLSRELLSQPQTRRHNPPALPGATLCLCVVLATGRAAMLLNNLRVTPEHLSNHENTDVIPKGKLTPIYLQNTVAFYIIPFLRKEMLDYPHRQQSPCIPKAAWRIQKIISSHSLALCSSDNQAPFLSLCVQYCPTLWTYLTTLFPGSDSWEKKKEEEGRCVTAAGEFSRSSQSASRDMVRPFSRK